MGDAADAIGRRVVLGNLRRLRQRGEAKRLDLELVRDSLPGLLATVGNIERLSSSWYEINGLIELIADFLAVTDASIDRLEQLLREEPHG